MEQDKGGIYMTGRIRVSFTVSLLIMAICLCACSSDPKKQFVGTWNSTGPYSDSVTVTFNADGTFKWVRHYTGRDLATTGRYEPDEKEHYLTMYPDKDPNDKTPFSENEWGFRYVVTSDYITFYKKYSEEPVYAFQRQK